MQKLYDKAEIERLFEKWCRKLRITPAWTVRLDLIEDPTGRKTGDIQIDCEDRQAIVILNLCGSSAGNPEHIIVHELLHLKMYPLDQTTETLIDASFAPDTPGYAFAYTTFMETLEQTVEELSKCFLLEFGENRDIAFGRCEKKKSFTELYEGLKNLE